jgi:hypothetical protein
MAITTQRQRPPQAAETDNRRPSQNETRANEDSTSYVSSLNIINPTAMEAQERAQIDVQIATARRFPRDIVRARERMMQYATLDGDTAQACFYTLKRKDEDGSVKYINGPSIRLAEIALSCYGNIRGAARVIDNDGRKLTSQGVCIDLENNVAISMEVQRRITNRYGNTYSDDMQIVTGNAANAIALRNAVFKVIPQALIKPVYEAAMDFAVGKGQPVAQRWQRAVNQFEPLGVLPDMLIKWLKIPNATKVSDEHFKLLLGLLTSLKDGELTVETVFHDEDDKHAPQPDVVDFDEQRGKSAARKEVGPFVEKDFAKEEYGLLLKMWREAKFGNKAQFDAFLNHWTASREDLTTHLKEKAGDAQ